jgi:hypothetical protein
MVLALKPILLPEQGERIAILLRDEQLLDASMIQYVGKPALAGKIRVQTDGAAQLDQIEHPKRRLTPEHDVVLIANAAEAQCVDLSGYRQVRIATGIGDVLPRDACWAFAGGELEAFLAAHQKDIILARRKGSHAERVGRIPNVRSGGF